MSAFGEFHGRSNLAVWITPDLFVRPMSAYGT